ncbi:protein S100-A1-like isoform X1 [Sinocyclocheilus grahami]|uniref:protein S100-A1-like isoform X1 n=1 Tax=Sinocyclocheilus grahami TaxID=75366 RepID=UPI0007AD27E0|nr:PREDICTED: protein S100-A1-like isoform X1 [Sinocyclocheilus grahami]
MRHLPIHIYGSAYLAISPAQNIFSKEESNNMVSKLEDAMEGLIKVFHTYSSKEGDKYKLSKAELKSLLQGELSDFLAVRFSHIKASKDPMVVEKIMSDLDENQDGEVDFQEFVVLVAALTVACNEFFVQSMKN